MINDSDKEVNIKASTIIKTKDVYKPIRKRSLSGSSVPSKSWYHPMKIDIRGKKITELDSKKDFNSGRILSEIEVMEKSVDSLSSSSVHNMPDTGRKSNSSVKSDLSKHTNQQQCNWVSTKMKLKHFLSEHIVRTHHHCHHPEYHNNKKNGSDNISQSDLKIDCSQERSDQGSSESSLSKESSTHRPTSDHELGLLTSPVNIASSVLDRIRNINIQSNSPTLAADNTETSLNMNSSSEKHELITSVSLDSQNNFPFPEPNPSNLPRVVSPCSLDFSFRHILPDKPKHRRLAHSVSCDQDYPLTDICRSSHKKTFGYTKSMGPKFIPEKDKWEKKISGYLDTSTSTGATLTAINFGLKRVTETDKYLMITTSPTSCPNAFLEDGISHIEATSEIYQSLMRHSTCYDLMPDSGKVIIVHSHMEIGRAFEAIEENTVRASPIWSSEKQDFIALLTVNDLVPLLLYLHRQNTEDDPEDSSDDDDDDFEDLDHVTVEKCLSIIPTFRTLQNHIVQVTPETNLQTVISLFNQFHKSMLLVIDSFLSGNPLFLLTGWRILTYLYYKVHSICTDTIFKTSIAATDILFNKKIEILPSLSDNDQSGDNVISLRKKQIQYFVSYSSPIIDVLRAMADSFCCCAMLVEDNVKARYGGPGDKYIIKDVITLADILNLIKMKKHKIPRINAKDILNYRKEYHDSMTYRDPVISFCVNDSVSNLIHAIVKEKASFVLIRSTNEVDSYTIGILTVHDVLTYIDNLPYNATEIQNNVSGLSRNTTKHHGNECEKSEKMNSDINWPKKSVAGTNLEDFLEESD